MASALDQRSSIIMSGGGSTSDPMMQIVADVFAVPASRARVTNGAAVGAAICAAVAVIFETAARAMVQMADTFTDPPTVATYDELIDTYAAARSAR